MFIFFLAIESYRTTESTQNRKKVSVGRFYQMPKQLVRICPSDRFCRVQNLPTSSVELIWPITELYFRQILATDFMNRFYLDVLIESVHKICRQNLSKIKLCDWPNKLDATS